MGTDGARRGGRRGWRMALAAVALVASACVPELDGSFDDDGVTTTQAFPGAWHDAASVVVQPDGKIVVLFATRVVGSLGALARFEPDGTPDASFGNGGVVLTEQTVFATCSKLLLQPDGKFLVSGWVKPNDMFGVARYNSDGTLDSAFGDDGYAHVGQQSGEACDVALQPDGMILAGGAFEWRQFRVVRFTADGSVDESFGIDGVASVIPDTRTGATNALTNIALLPDGRILTTGCSRWGDPDQPTWFSFARFDGDGQLDATFDDDGVATLPLGGCAVDLEARADGSSRSLGTVAARYAPDGHAHVVIVGLTAGGDLDATFGTGGVANVLDDANGQAFLRRPDGKFLVVADDLTGVGGEVSGGETVILARLTPAGAPDTSFGDGGIASTDAVAGQEIAHDLAAHADGRAVVVATVPDQGDGSGTDVGVYRFIID